MLNSIACENCRSKKCKCDRELPVCSQCQTSSLVCQYQEGGKRGLPAAYITSLEKRLHETETALSATLLTLQNRDAIKSVDTSFNRISSASAVPPRSKAERQEDWKLLPLQKSEHLIAWLKSKHPHNIASNTEQSIFLNGLSDHQSSYRDGVGSIPDVPTIGSLAPSNSEQHATSSHVTSQLSQCQIMEQLKYLSPPPAPNASSDPSYSRRWHENYF